MSREAAAAPRRGLGARLAEAAETVRALAGNRPLARVQAAWLASNTGSWAYFVAIAVFAYDDGGAAAVGIIGFLRLAVPALTAPFLAMLADRFRRTRVMVLSDLAVTAALGGSAVALAAGASAVLVYALVVVAEVAHSPFRPAQAALLPSLARDPRDLAAANLVAATIETVGSFVGPAVAAVLLAISPPEVTMGAMAGLFLCSAVLVRGVPERTPERASAEHEPLGDRLLAGGRAIVANGDMRLLITLYAAQTVVGGMLAVLIVVLSFEEIGLGADGVGWLNAVVGVGGLVGSFATVVLLRRLGSAFAAGMLLWGLPLAALALSPTLAVAVAMLLLVGVGNTLVDVAGITLMQRAIPEDVLARAFGALESVLLAALGLGLLTAPLLDAALGTRAALVVAGLPLAGLAALFWRRLIAVERSAPARARELELLRALPIFAPLPPATVEALAAQLERERFAGGTEVLRQGDPGDRFYVVSDGELDVEIDGAQAPRLQPGDAFGEIALLRDVPRTATVVAATDVELYSLARDDFIAAVAGHAQSEQAAALVVATRLASLRPLGVAP